MKLQAEVQNEKYSVEIKRDGEKLFAKIEEREYELVVSEVEPDVYLLKNGNKIHQVYVASNGIVNIGNHQLEVNLIDLKRLRGSAGSGSETNGAAEIKTAMPGKVVRILVEAGKEIQKGEGVIVVEAMKMQNEMKAPKDGVIKEIKVEEGKTVNAGDVLVIIE